ncbi:MAG: MFS transporter [Planctomycetes bacterium]|nr:MFS transporter [Planctomycetota bacterium]
MAILAAGVSFAIRGGILDNWKSEFGFTSQQLGSITGGGLSGFCFGIIIGGVVVDKLGYGKLVVIALIGHVLSAVVTLGATQENAYNMLFWGSFIFAYANGTLEAVANPLVATIFPHNRTHYLNILHASWPAGLVIGSALGWVFDDQYKWPWQYQLALYLIPVALYAIMFIGQHFPKSEAAASGTSFADMFKSVGILGALVACYLLALFFGDILKEVVPGASNYIGYAIGGTLVIAVGVLTKFSIGSFVLFMLFIAHALVGAVELGTDSWIQNITGNLFSSEQGKYLFLWTSAIMFGLRFCAHWIETKLKLTPIALLLVCSIIASIGLYLSSGMTSFAVALVAMGVYAVGKTFFWPTMLAVVGDRYPKSGAVAMSIMGGIGMLSAGLVGGPGLGYSKDRFAGEELRRVDAAVAEKYKADKPSRFLNIPATEVQGLNGAMLEKARKEKSRSEEQRKVIDADQRGDRTTLRVDALIPAAMAGIYLLLLVYFQSIGGYRPRRIEEEP